MIESDPTRAWKMADFLAAVDGSSAPRLSNSFKAVTGNSIFSYLKPVRIARSPDLIRRGQVPLVEVAQTMRSTTNPHSATAFPKSWV